MHLDIIKQKKFVAGILSTLLILPSNFSDNQQQEFDYQFFQKNNYYSLCGSFIVQAKQNCLMEVIFNFEHITKYAVGAKSIEMVQQGENWHLVTYTYRKFLFFENKSTWRRTLKPVEQKVIFKMVTSSNNLPLMPAPLNSSGYYQIKPTTAGYLVEYFQQCQLKANFLKDSYLNLAKKDAIKFLAEFKAYIEKTCQ